MKTSRFRRCFVSIVLFLLLLSAVGYLFWQHNRLSFFYSADSFQESTAVLDNPYQGFYHIRGYYPPLEETALENYLQKHIAWDADYNLVLLEINLNHYQSRNIDAEGLAQLDRIFSAWAESGKQMIVRFLYDWDGKARETEPDNLDQILAHMEQVAPVINAYTDHIYILQGIFVGFYGEMHNSNHMDDDTMCKLIQKLADLTDSSIYLSVRTPAQWRTITGLQNLPEKFPAFSESLTGRLGLFNDGMLGSDIDVGTYGYSSRFQSDSLSAKGTREEELAFQELLCRYVPNGGEVVIDNPFNDLSAAIGDLSRMHVSYLNDAHDKAVLDKWKNTVYRGDDIFDGCSGYDYIAAKLGYRYVLRSSSLSREKHPDTVLLHISLENTGFAGSLKAFSMEVTLHNRETMEDTTLLPGWDIRFLESMSAKDYSLSLPLKKLAPGDYDLYFRIIDPVSGRQIRLANTAEFTDYGYHLGTLTVQ